MSNPSTTLRCDINKLPTPCYVIDRGLLQANLDILAGVQQRTGAKILLALKGFACWSVFDQVNNVLSGAAASSLHEARLAREFFRGEVHLCAPAYRADEIDEFVNLCDHIVFNTPGQFRRYRDKLKKGKKTVQAGLRVNPRHSEVKTAIYDPCASGSRLGTTVGELKPGDFDGFSGLHFHTLCELNSDALERTLAAVEAQFGEMLQAAEWVNLGGGHHITRPDYDVERLIQLIEHVRDRYRVQVYLEPGEAIALNTGFLVSEVLDVMRHDIDIAILDTSASAHMPDVLEMPYRPHVTRPPEADCPREIMEEAAQPGEKTHTYRLTGMTCLAGDVIGDYSFDAPLRPGDRLIFHDMAHYTMVKNTMFNGINLPDIVLYDPARDTFTVQRHFDYVDFKKRLS